MYCGQCSEESADALDVFSQISGIYIYSYEVSFIFIVYITQIFKTP